MSITVSFLGFNVPIFESVLLFCWLVYLWDSYISWRQHQVFKISKAVPNVLKDKLSATKFEKSRLYSLDKSSFGFWHGLFSQIENTIILLAGGIPYVWYYSGHLLSRWGYNSSYEITQSLVFLVLVTLYNLVTDTPWSLYSTFVIEERHGFNKQTLRFYVWDKIKKLVVSLIIMLPIAALLIKIIKIGGPYFFIYAWLFALIVSLLLLTIYPEYIAPLFDKYIPLPESKLRTEIEKLALKIGFPLTKIYVVDGSTRSAHSNAYFYGFWKNKRIVLFDTLLLDFVMPKDDKKNDKEIAAEPGAESAQPVDMQEQETTGDGAGVDGNKPKEEVIHSDDRNEPKEHDEKKGCSDDEVLAVLGHELGHWKLNHTIFNLIISQINTLFCFFVFGLLIDKLVLYRAFGFSTQPTIIGLIIIMQFIFSPYHEVLTFVMTCLSRVFEFQADRFSAELGYTELLKSGLVKLHIDNLGFPYCDWLYSLFTHSHPPLLERLAALDLYIKETTRAE